MRNNIITKLVPYAYLNKGFQEYIAANSQPENIKAGEVICSQGDDASSVLFLLKGRLKVTSATKETLRGPSSLSVSRGYYKHSASIQATEDALILRVNLSPKQQDTLLCWQFSSRFLNNTSWFMQLKTCAMFDHVPPSNILRLGLAFKEKITEAGEVIIQEDQFEQKFFVLLEGSASVFRGEITESNPPISHIYPPSCFGEAGLIPRLPRTASIKMPEKGKLMVLDRDDLDPLLDEAIHDDAFISSKQLKTLLEEKNTHILDIRTEKERSVSQIKGMSDATISASIDKPKKIKNMLAHIAEADPQSNYIIYSPYQHLNKLIYQLLKNTEHNFYILK